jgi:NAD(P)H-hydrate epimerase
MSTPAPSLPVLPQRRVTSHKGEYGRALLVGGSRGMSGAIGLAGLAALRSGAGLVTLAVPDVCLDTVASYEPSYMTLALESDAGGRIAGASKGAIQHEAGQASCCACGPGIGRSPQLNELVGLMYESLRQPVVVDADGLNALASDASCLPRPGGPRILTPHPGEFRRLVGNERLSPEACRTRAVELAGQCGVTVVLKGHRTLVTDGQQVLENSTGNPGMATGGSGDVLTGVITALVGQGLSPLEAAHLGVYVHGLAGDLAAGQLGQTSLVASDLVRWLPAAFLKIDTQSESEPP